MNRYGGPRTEASKGTPRTRYVVAVLAIAIGVAGVVAAGIDDRRAASSWGVLLIIGAVVLGVRMVKRNR